MKLLYQSATPSGRQEERLSDRKRPLIKCLFGLTMAFCLATGPIQAEDFPINSNNI